MTQASLAAPAGGKCHVFITGGSGFLGRATVAALLAAGHEVSGLARSASAAQVLRSLGALPVPGELGAKELAHLRGAEVLVHAAAPVVFWGPWSRFEAEVVQASVAWFRHAASQGVRRFVHISSESVLQGSGPLLDVDESHPMAEPPNGDYGRAKKMAELALQQEARRWPQCELLILRPTFIWGPGVPALQTLVDKVRAGQFVWVDHGSSAFERVHVANVAHAIECALHRGRPGQAYLITDGVAGTVRETLAPLLREQGVKVPTASMPSWLAVPAAAAVERVWRALGWMHKPPPLSRFDLAFVAQPRRYRIDKARNELGYSPRHFQPGGAQAA